MKEQKVYLISSLNLCRGILEGLKAVFPYDSNPELNLALQNSADSVTAILFEVETDGEEIT